MSEEAFVKSSSLLPSAFCRLPSALFLESHCQFGSPFSGFAQNGGRQPGFGIIPPN
ncbi:MAG: hypothetical protein F6K14_03985 [Symploca sp. SIO2C1]|nr:hypothetical protein [Symploca sp. SIO2C1]